MRFVCLIRVPVCPVCVPAPPGLFMEEPTSALLAQAVRVQYCFTATGVTRLPRAPSFRRPPSSRRGEALWERVEAGSGSLGVASSESAAGSGRLRACGC